MTGNGLFALYSMPEPMAKLRVLGAMAVHTVLKTSSSKQ